MCVDSNPPVSISRLLAVHNHNPAPHRDVCNFRFSKRKSLVTNQLSGAEFSQVIRFLCVCFDSVKSTCKAKSIDSMAVQLTCEQEECVKKALEGHNFSIFGEAGTGKSRVVSEICRLKGKGVRVVCSTGIACEVFKDDGNLSFPAVTVHSFIGVGTAQGSFNSVVEKACSNQRIRKELLEAKYVVWDECSMASSRLLKLFHAITLHVRDKKLPFGGIQTILVGDWLQLKPVMDKFDDGEPMYKSVLFPSLLPHTMQLNIVHQQKEHEVVYCNILGQLPVGRCDNDSEQAISGLLRDLNNADGAIHLYFTNLHVNAHNVSCLDLLPRERESFMAIDIGDLRGLNCPAPKMSCFKSGAPVVVLYNIRDLKSP